MCVSQKLMFHQSKCISAIKHILSITAMYISSSSFMNLCFPSYCDVCLKSRALLVEDVTHTIQYMFGFIITCNVHKPRCILCFKIFGNGSTKLSIFRAHFTSSHPTHAHDNHVRCSCWSKRARFRATRTLLALAFVSEEKSGLEESYRIAFGKAKEKKPQRIGERLNT